MSQLTFDSPLGPPPSEHRVNVLANVIAGFRWPDRGGFQKLTKAQQKAAHEAAEMALRHVAAELSE